MTGIFFFAMLLVCADILFVHQLTSSDSAMLTLVDALGERYGQWARILFLVGFLAVTWTSLLGVWNGVSLLFHDWTRTIRLPHGAKAEIGAEVADRAPGDPQETATGYEARTAERSVPFRAYLLWLTLPPMALLFL